MDLSIITDNFIPIYVVSFGGFMLYMIYRLAKVKRKLALTKEQLRETFIERHELFNLTEDQAKQIPFEEMRRMIHRKYGI